MNKGRYWLFAATIVVVVGVAMWFIRGRPGEPAPSSAAVQMTAQSQSGTLPVVEPAPGAGHRGEQTTVPAPSPSTAGVTTEAPAVPTPLDVTPGFEPTLAPEKEPSDVSLTQVPLRQHRKLQAEARDEAWAGGAESDIRSLVEKELTAHGLDTHRVELPVLECRSTGCEIQAIGHPEDVRNNRAADLQFIVPKLFETPRGAEFDRNGTSVMLTSLPDGRVGYVVFLWRKPL